MDKEIRLVNTEEEGLGVAVRFGDTVYLSATPAEAEIKETEGGFRSYRKGYDHVEETEAGYRCQALVQTAYGSRISFQDAYEWRGEELVFSRRAEVLYGDGREAGFATSFGLQEQGGYGLEDYEVFIPGIWYRRNEHVVNKAFGADRKDRYSLIRITRMAMPYVEFYRPESGSYVTIRHLAPEPSVGMKETGADWMMDASFRYASMGIRNGEQTELVYQFPGSEGERNYIDGAKAWAKRSHPLREGFVQEYSFSILGGRAQESYEAMRRVWRFFYEQKKPEHVKADIDRVYQDGIDLLDVYCQEYNGAMGLPFWTLVPEGNVCDISFQMGFVGQQTMCAYQLMRYGYLHGKEEMVRKACQLIDFWVRESMKDSVVPRVWYNAFPAAFKEEYPTYTRTAADGMEGILACYLCAAREGRREEAWLDFCTRYADWLVRSQNEDGSFYRAYNAEGEPVHRGKYNTTNVIRFLVNLYWASGKEEYREAARRAGNFCYDRIYVPMCYVGGTADNDNTVDKEAGMIAVYAFTALYDMDGDERWLEAAKGAADFTETWTYVWDYEVKPYKGNAVFDRANITGLSLIATGHSHADVMMGYMPYEYYRLYLHTGDPHYREFGLFLNGNTKQTTDWSGRLGHAYPGLVEESGELAMQYHNGLGKWLPWCTIALIESLTRFEERFGCMDVEEIDGRDAALKKADNHKQGYSWLAKG